MMKLGCLSLSYRPDFNDKQMNLERFINTAHELELDGIELHTSAFESTDDEYLRDVRMSCLKRGLVLDYIAVSNNFGKPESELPAEVENVKKWVDIAVKMGVPVVRIFAAWIPEGVDETATWERMIGCMKEVAEYGEEKGVVIGLQNHNHGCLTRTGDDVVRILKEVDNPYFSHILDTGQYVGSPGASGSRGKEDPMLNFYGSIEKSAPYAIHVRAKINRIQTGEESWLDYPRIFSILREVGYNGFISIVYEGWQVEDAETAVPKAVKYLRQCIQQGGDTS
jgi:sugar phosphate isomerase/epimerase